MSASEATGFDQQTQCKLIKQWIELINLQYLAKQISEIQEYMALKLNWNIEEQQFLKQIVQNTRNLIWNEVAAEMSMKFPESIRTGKQYRERYVNYIQLEENAQKTSNWTEEEEKSLFQGYWQLGTKWTQIAKIIPTKSENALKNKFYGSIRKALRKINRIGKQNIKKFNKSIRYQSLIKIMDAAGGGDDLPSDIKTNSVNIKKHLLNLAQNCDKDFDVQKISEMIKQIHKFNIATRCYSSKKWKRNAGSSTDLKPESICNNSILDQRQCNWQDYIQNGEYLYKSAPIFFQQNHHNFKSGSSAEAQREQTLSMYDYKTKDALQCNSIIINEKKQINETLEIENISKENHDDLQLELCGILGENYESYEFNFFEE